MTPEVDDQTLDRRIDLDHNLRRTFQMATLSDLKYLGAPERQCAFRAASENGLELLKDHDPVFYLAASEAALYPPSTLSDKMRFPKLSLKVPYAYFHPDPESFLQWKVFQEYGLKVAATVTDRKPLWVVFLPNTDALGIARRVKRALDRSRDAMNESEQALFDTFILAVNSVANGKFTEPTFSPTPPVSPPPNKTATRTRRRHSQGSGTHSPISPRPPTSPKSPTAPGAARLDQCIMAFRHRVNTFTQSLTEPTLKSILKSPHSKGRRGRHITLNVPEPVTQPDYPPEVVEAFRKVLDDGRAAQRMNSAPEQPNADATTDPNTPPSSPYDKPVFSKATDAPQRSPEHAATGDQPFTYDPRIIAAFSDVLAKGRGPRRRVSGRSTTKPSTTMTTSHPTPGIETPPMSPADPDVVIESTSQLPRKHQRTTPPIRRESPLDQRIVYAFRKALGGEKGQKELHSEKGGDDSRPLSAAVRARRAHALSASKFDDEKDALMTKSGRAPTLPKI